MTKDGKKIVIVLGAYGGVGFEVCRYNYARGARVVMVGRDPAKLKEARDQFDNKSALAIVGDANNPDDVRAVFAKTAEKYGEPDEVWVTIGKDGGWERDFPSDPPEKKQAIWDKLYPSLLKPIEVACPIAEEVFRKQGHGILVHLSSHAAQKGEDELAGNETYRKLKLAAEVVVNEMRKRLAGTGATAVNLRPAIISTPGTAKLLGSKERRAEAVQPESLAEWVDKNADDPNIPESHYFHSDVTLS